MRGEDELHDVLDDAASGEGKAVRLVAHGAGFLLFLMLTPLYFSRLARPGDAVRAQRLVSTAAFVVWAYALGGPFRELGIHKGWLAGILLILFSALAGLYPPRR